MQKFPSVTVIILNHNGLEDIKECLKSLLETKYKNFSILLIDNGSLVNEANIIKKEFHNKKLKVIRFNKNLGFSGGNNRAIKKSHSKYLVLLNNDVKVSANWLSELVNTVEKDKTIAVCQPKIKSFFYPNFFEYAGGSGGFIDKLGYPYARGRIGFHLEEDIGQYDSIKEIVWASGSCFFIRKKVLHQTGLLSSDFFFYHEETDLCLRIKRLGYKIISVPKSIVWHKGAATSKKNLGKRIFFVHRNALLLIARNFSLRTLIWLMPLRIVLDFFSLGLYLLDNQSNSSFSVLSAHLSFLMKIPNILKFRLSFKPKKNINIEKELFPISIFWEYFFKKKRRFSEIAGNNNNNTKLMYYDKMLNFNNKQKIKKVLSNQLIARGFHKLQSLFKSIKIFLSSK